MIVLSAKSRMHPFQEDDLELLMALASAAAMRLRNIALAEETARRRLLDRELELARDIQMAMLPKAFPHLGGIDVSAALRPARTVGGDLYDVMADGERVWLLVGDVSGKGVGAALFMAVTKTLFRAIAPGSASVAEAVARMNRELARDNERAMFVTAFAARLDVGTGELEYVNAGHNPTYRLEADRCRRTAARPGRPGPRRGRSATSTGRPGCGSRRGDAVLLYTDGVVEARSAASGRGRDAGARWARRMPRRSSTPCGSSRTSRVAAKKRPSASSRACSSGSTSSSATHPSTTTSRSSRYAGSGRGSARGLRAAHLPQPVPSDEEDHRGAGERDEQRQSRCPGRARAFRR